MIEALLTLLACQLIGETLARALDLPIPGPVFGMALLLALLVWRGRGASGRSTQADPAGEADVPPELGRVGQGLLSNLSLLFVPAAVGVIQHVRLIGDNLVAIVVALAVSTAAALCVAALTFAAVARWQAGRTS